MHVEKTEPNFFDTFFCHVIEKKQLLLMMSLDQLSKTPLTKHAVGVRRMSPVAWSSP